uniref:F-box only protein 8-like n=1 Tax=Nicotiana sylvestris TaxID=4096 RepID=A0A1U7V7V9_NICSY|nr:PREDICTED: F-box only protein 8-like [Nicotiana sylvestris]
MVWFCLSRKPREHSKHIPDDILIDILSKLPAQDLLHCRQVCRHWNSLISTPFFNDMYLNLGAVSTVILQQKDLTRRSNGYQMKLLFLPEKHQNKTLRKKKRKDYSYYIINPLTQELVTFDLPFGQIQAFYFHPVAKEYYAIWIYVNTKSPSFVEFKILKLSLLLSDNLDVIEVETGWEKVCDVVPHIAPRSMGSPTWTKEAIYCMADRLCGLTVTGIDHFES